MKPEHLIQVGALCQKLFNMAEGYKVQIRPYHLFNTIWPVAVATDPSEGPVPLFKWDFVSLQPVGIDFLFWVGYAPNANILIVMENGVSDVRN